MTKPVHKQAKTADVRCVDIGGSLVRDYSKTVFQFQENLRVMVIDRERAAIGMEEVVAQGGVELVVEGIIGTEAVVDAAISDVNVGEGLEGVRGGCANQREIHGPVPLIRDISSDIMRR